MSFQLFAFIFKYLSNYKLVATNICAGIWMNTYVQVFFLDIFVLDV